MSVWMIDDDRLPTQMPLNTSQAATMPDVLRSTLKKEAEQMLLHLICIVDKQQWQYFNIFMKCFP